MGCSFFGWGREGGKTGMDLKPLRNWVYKGGEGKMKTRASSFTQERTRE